jgi:hypothetical protein
MNLGINSKKKINRKKRNRINTINKRKKIRRRKNNSQTKSRVKSVNRRKKVRIRVYLINKIMKRMNKTSKKLKEVMFINSKQELSVILRSNKKKTASQLRKVYKTFKDQKWNRKEFYLYKDNNKTI